MELQQFYLTYRADRKLQPMVGEISSAKQVEALKMDLEQELQPKGALRSLRSFVAKKS